jgi:uncharacterized protein YfaS (alpha-2-macroglobulin family)
VRHTREILIERAASTWRLAAAQRFTAPGGTVTFLLQPESGGNAVPARWELLRLENRQRSSGALAGNARAVAVKFSQPGSYSLQVFDADNNVLAATEHWVSGDGIAVAPGNIEIVFDKRDYRSGETATALVTFPEAVDDVLLSLERDKVEKTALLSHGSHWVKTKKIAERQWQVDVTVQDTFAPNIVFSAAYVKNNQFVFQNQGIRVAQAAVTLAFKPEREVYKPGETVNIDISATLNGKPVIAPLSVGVVDEMIYVLQPEIAPDIREFFFHPRRNNVRTTASFSFIGYDVSTDRLGQAPERAQVNERAIKVLERPRRDNVDTVYWNPKIVTGADGRTRISFVMPESLTRWRVTARAMHASGAVGQASAYLRSEKPYYVKWTSPDWLRQGDRPVASVAVFNNLNRPVSAELHVTSAASFRHAATLTLQPGINFAAVPLENYAGGTLNVALISQGSTLDSLAVPLRRVTANWRRAQTRWLTLNGKTTALALPADAYDVRVTLAPTVPAHLARIAGDLIDFPYGCIEQTASRMMPLTLAYRALETSNPVRAREISRQLYSQRLRLARMANPEGRFGWWGAQMPVDPFLTAWAYYADWQAAQALRIALPESHWQTLLEVYREGAPHLSYWQRALMLDWMRHMKLPTGSLLAGLLVDLQRAEAVDDDDAQNEIAQRSMMFDKTETLTERSLAWVLAGGAYTALRLPAIDGVDATLRTHVATLKASPLPLAQGLLIYVKQLPADNARTLLPGIGRAHPTLDRALLLDWMQYALGNNTVAATGKGPALTAPWQAVTAQAGNAYFRVATGQALPASLTLTAAPAKPVNAMVSFESASAAEDQTELPVTVKRRLYLLVRNSNGSFLRREVDEADVKTGELYLEEITLSNRDDDQPVRFGLLEVPLPPGATLETGTWGIQLADSTREGDEGRPLDGARGEATAFGYAVPLDALATGVTLRHLVRFAQRGRFVLPAARFYTMYDSNAVAFENDSDSTRTITVQ